MRGGLIFGRCWGKQRCQWVMGKNPDLLFLRSKKAILGQKKLFLGHTVSLKIRKNSEIREFLENWHLWVRFGQRRLCWNNFAPGCSNLSCLLDMQFTGPVMVLCSTTLDGHRLSVSCVFLMNII